MSSNTKHGILDRMGALYVFAFMAAIAGSPVGDTGKPSTPVASEFVRLGTTKSHLIDIDKTSIKVQWEDDRDRVVRTVIRLIPQEPTFIETPLTTFRVANYVGVVAVNCTRGSAIVESSRTFAESGFLLNVDISGGPLAMWKNFGAKPTSELVTFFCEASTVKRQLKKVPML